MGLFGKKKTVDLADNEYYFPMNFFRYVLEDNALLIKLINKKGLVTDEQVIPYRKITNVTKTSRGGGQFAIKIYLDDDRNGKPEIEIFYKEKTDGEQAERFYRELQSRL